MLSPFMNHRMGRSGRRKQSPPLQSPVGMTPVVSPTETAPSRSAAISSSSSSSSSPLVSPQDPRMTPTRRMLFQRKRLSSNARGASGPSTFFTSRDGGSDAGRSQNHKNSITNGTNNMDSQNKKIQERFNSIQRGLGSIDEERSTLMDKSKRLEQEKKHIQKQLQLREREILALVKRCASQEEKMRESSKLRLKNRELKEHLDKANFRLMTIEEEQADLHSLKTKLQDSELDREHLKDRLARVQREYDSIADTLQDCMAKIRKLTEEREELEEERRNERKRAESELERQRLEHVEQSNNLQEDIQLQQTRIIQMEKILKDNMYSNTNLRRENAMLLSKREREEGDLEATIQRYEQQMEDVQQQLEHAASKQEAVHENHLKVLQDEMKKKKAGYDAKLLEMKGKLDEKECIIERLQEEFSEKMAEVIAKQTRLDQAEEAKKDLEERFKSVANIETQHAALIDYVQVVDSNMASLMMENHDLQQQLDSLHDDNTADETGGREVIQAENEEVRAKHESALGKARQEIEDLQRTLSRRNDTIIGLESDLGEANRVILQKELDMEYMRENLSTTLSEARAEVSQLKSKVYAEKETRENGTQVAVECAENSTQTVSEEARVVLSLVSCAAQTEDSEECFMESKETRALQDKLEQGEQLLEERQQQILHLEEKYSELQKMGDDSAFKLEVANKTIKELEKQMSENKNDTQSALLLDELDAARNSLSEQMTRNRLMEDEQEAKLVDMQSQIAHLTSRSAELEKSIQQSVHQLAEKERTIATLEKRAKELDEERAKVLSEFHDKTQCLDDTKSLLERSRSDLATVRIEMEDAKSGLAELEVSVHHLDGVTSNNRRTIQSLRQLLSNSTKEVADLQRLLEQMERDSTILEVQLNEARENPQFNDVLVDLEMKLEIMERDNVSAVAENTKLKAEVEEATRLANNLSDEFSEARKSLMDTQNSRKEEIHRLERKIQTLTTNVALKEDEIRELRLVELQDAEEAISSLQDETRQYQSEAQELKSRLELQDAAIRALKRQLSDEQQRRRNSFTDHYKLSKREEGTRQEMENLKLELDLAVLRERELADTKVKDAISELVTARTKLKQAESFGTERSSLLAKIVKQNTDLGDKLEKALSDCSALETTRGELETVKEELERKETSTDSKLKRLKQKYDEDLSKSRRRSGELEKENEELKDRIKRQDAHMKRKLEKEKTLRERNSTCTPNKHGSAMKTPSRRPTTGLKGRSIPLASASSAARPRSRLAGPSPSLRRHIKASMASASISPTSVSSKPGLSHRPSSGLPAFRTPTTKASKSVSSISSPSVSSQGFDENLSVMSDELSDILRTPSPKNGKQSQDRELAVE